MKAYTYVKPGLASFVDVDKPVIRKPTDAIVRIVKTTICGTDLHIIKGDVPQIVVFTIRTIASVGLRSTGLSTSTKEASPGLT